MEYCCGNCEVLDMNDRKWGDEYYCKVLRKYIKLDHTPCSSFIKNKSTFVISSGFILYEEWQHPQRDLPP